MYYYEDSIVVCMYIYFDGSYIKETSTIRRSTFVMLGGWCECPFVIDHVNAKGWSTNGNTEKLWPF